MSLRRFREQREARRDFSAQSKRPALYCQDCEAKLKPDATVCYCGSRDLGTSQPSFPQFSEVAVDGACPKCHGTSFRPPKVDDTTIAGGFLAGGLLGAAIAAKARATPPDGIIVCVTCGAPFRLG